MSSVVDVTSELPWQLAPLAADWRALREAVASWTPDLIVTVARRAPRTDEALDLHFDDVATTVSDLAIPWCADYVRGARVAIVDDIINVGSTLRHAADALEARGASEIGMFALRARAISDDVDKVASVVQLVGSDPRSDVLCDELAQQAPALIARLNKSYDLDFPIIGCHLVEPGVNGNDLFTALDDEFPGLVFDISSGVGKSLGLSRLTIDWPLGDGRFAKARLYHDARTGALNFVPMFLTTPLPTAVAADDPAWAQEIRRVLLHSLPPGHSEGEAHARVELFVASLRFGVAVLRRLRPIVVPANANLISVDDARLIFGPIASELFVASSAVDLPDLPIESAAPSDPAVSKTSPAYQHLWTPELRAEIEDTRASNDPISNATAVFGVLARLSGSEHVAKYELSWPYTSAQIAEDEYKRLRIGFTFSDLSAILAELSEQQRSPGAWRRTTSKILDILIDCGMVVPTIGFYDGCFYRIYRKGEAPSRNEVAERVILGMDMYHKPMSATRLSKVGAIVSFMTPSHSGARVMSVERGNVLGLDADVVDGSAEISQFLRRTRQVRMATNLDDLDDLDDLDEK